MNKTEAAEINKAVKELTKLSGESFLKGDKQKALEYLNEAIEDYDSTNHVLLYNRSQLLTHMNRLTEALESVNESLRYFDSYEPAIQLKKVIEKKLNDRYRTYA